jgi:subtilisin family serine protease
MSNLYSRFFISREFPDLSDPAILSVEPLPNPRLLNRWATGFVQSSHVTLRYRVNQLITDRPIHEHGVTGSGVIVTIIDSGLDARLCQFSDPRRPPPYDRDDWEHPEIVRYDAFADCLDTEAGHGTHVSGVLAGNAGCVNCSAGMYDGHTPDAKLYFVDCGEQRYPSVLISDMRFPGILSNMRRFGCKVMSNSWGFPPAQVGDSYRVIFDEIAFDHPDVIMLFGAGNSRRMNDIHSPGNSKNTFAVGGTSNLDVVGALDSRWVLVVGNKSIPLHLYS